MKLSYWRSDQSIEKSNSCVATFANTTLSKDFSDLQTAMLATRTPWLNGDPNRIHKNCIWYICSERSLYSSVPFFYNATGHLFWITFTKIHAWIVSSLEGQGYFYLLFCAFIFFFLMKEPLDSVQRKTWCLRSALYFSSFFLANGKQNIIKESKTFSLCIALRECASLFLSMPPTFESFL